MAPGTLVIHNVDQRKQTPLVGATSRLETAAGKVVRQQIVIGAAGQVVVDNLKAGDYQLIQTTAATAYRVTPTPIAVKIQGNHEITPITVGISKLQALLLLIKWTAIPTNHWSVRSTKCNHQGEKY